ncbi:proteasome assembly chaperone 3-like isoform X2 [Ptychodera flava]|uniref:proteasome assembly chaperone 3-like isoform X2 n=1 Tax=Ptychodera flava TaxID=63121 RepID=UPI003969CF86
MAPNRLLFGQNVEGAVTIDGVHTDVICTAFSDRLFIVVTQFQKLGTLVHVTKDLVGFVDLSSPSFTTKVLLGKDEPAVHIYAKNLASKICTEPTSKPLLLSLALKDFSPKYMQVISDLVLTHKVW